VAKLTKNQKKAHAKIEAGKAYTLQAAAALVKEITTTKFDASVDIDVSLGVIRVKRIKWYVVLLLYHTVQVKLFVF
jgi:ribosomal protein L1